MMARNTAEVSLSGKDAHPLDCEDAAIRPTLSIGSSPSKSDSPFPVAPPGPDDPIATPTIAAIYMRQGLPRRALQVYRDLLRGDPANEELRRRAQELEEAIRAEEESEYLATESEAAGRSAGEGGAPVSPAARRIEVLTRWAEAARRRKANVQ